MDVRREAEARAKESEGVEEVKGEVEEQGMTNEELLAQFQDKEEEEEEQGMTNEELLAQFRYRHDVRVLVCAFLSGHARAPRGICMHVNVSDQPRALLVQ